MSKNTKIKGAENLYKKQKNRVEKNMIFFEFFACNEALNMLQEAHNIGFRG